jgi:mRNA interferase MazF
MRRGDVVTMMPPGRRRGGAADHDQLAVVVQADDRLPSTLVLVAPLAASPQAITDGPEVAVLGTARRVLVELLLSMEAGRLGPPVDHLAENDLAALDTALRGHLGLG